MSIIKYLNKYSQPNFNRWAKVAKYRGLTIATINFITEGLFYQVILHFPVIKSNVIHNLDFTKNYKSVNSAKKYVKKTWDWFLNEIK